MQISKVLGRRVFLSGSIQYKEEKHKDLELVQYKGSLMIATVVFVGVDCKHVKYGEKAIYQAPVGVEVGFDNTKYLVLNEEDIMFVIAE